MFRLFVDRCYSKNHWYIISCGSFVAGPFDTKGDAITWAKQNEIR